MMITKKYIIKRNLLFYNGLYLKLSHLDVYKLFLATLYIFKCLCKGNIGKARDYINSKRTNMEVRNKSTSNKRKATFGTEYRGEKVAVYTVLFGNKDRITEPKIVDPNCDYYVITDSYVKENSIWHRLECNKLVADYWDDTVKSRYFKINSHIIFPNYKYSVYVDANIILYGFPSELICHINQKTGVALHNLPYRKSIYEEIYARERIAPSDEELLEKQKEDYIRQGFHSMDGLFECNVIIRENTKECIMIMEQWWDEFKKYPKRDQVSLPYILWKNDILQNSIGVIENDIRLNPYFRVIDHIAVDNK